jgi:hypothetical protein
MSEVVYIDPDDHEARQAEEKRKWFWKCTRLVFGAFFSAFIFTLFSNAIEPWAATAGKDRDGNLVVEPYWPLALIVSLVVGGVVAGAVLWACLTVDKDKKP